MSSPRKWTDAGASVILSLPCLRSRILWERRASSPPCAHTLHPIGQLHWTNHMCLKCFCVISLSCHQFPSLPTFLPQTVFIVITVHSSVPEPRSRTDPCPSQSLLFSTFMTVLKSFPGFLDSCFPPSYYFPFPSCPLLCLLIASSSRAGLGFIQHCCTAELPGALGLYEYPWSVASVHMAWSPSTRRALLLLFHHTFESRQVPCLLWGFKINFENLSNYTLALIPVQPLFSSALANSCAQNK